MLIAHSGLFHGGYKDNAVENFEDFSISGHIQVYVALEIVKSIACQWLYTGVRKTKGNPFLWQQLRQYIRVVEYKAVPALLKNIELD